MTLLNGGVSAGFSLDGLFGSGSSDSFARYAASRSIALLLTILIAICVRSRGNRLSRNRHGDGAGV
jgi:hypothetical protein